MATITNPQLTIAPDRRNHTADVRVTCEVHFTAEEIANMSKIPGRMYFSLYCSLYGHDAHHPRLKELDDELYTFAARTLPAAKPAQVEEATLSTTLSQDLLDEDMIGADEIYAQLELRGWIGFKGVLVTAQTNILSFAFT